MDGRGLDVAETATFYEAGINIYYFRRKFVRARFIRDNKLLIFRAMPVHVSATGPHWVLNRLFIGALISSIFLSSSFFFERFILIAR